MKTVLLLSLLVCAAFAAPAADEQKAPEAAVEAPEEHVAAAPAPAADEQKAPEAAVEAPEEHVAAAPAGDVEEAAAPQSGDVGETAAPRTRFNFCPDGWFSYNSRCFKFINTPLSWYSAEEHCNNLGANLASVSNPREYSFLQQMTQTAGQSIAWLGGFNLQGRWMWIDREGFYYTNWYSQSSPSSYPCMYLHSSCGWRNTQCGSGYRFICSKSPFSC